MHDLFERESQVLSRAKMFLGQEVDPSPDYCEEFIRMTHEYELLLRQARLMLRCSDLTANSLNSDKLSLLDRVNIDGLTGLYNRQFLEKNLRSCQQKLAESGGNIALLMLDIDFFKNYNDTYGHTAGDQCLQRVAGVLVASICREGDFAARFGGEEFIVVLPDTDRNGALTVAECIQANIRELAIPHSHNAVADHVTASIGVMSTRVNKNSNPLRYIECADAALYRSKRSGRNCITYSELEESLA